MTAAILPGGPRRRRGGDAGGRSRRPRGARRRRGRPRRRPGARPRRARPARAFIVRRRGHRPRPTARPGDLAPLSPDHDHHLAASRDRAAGGRRGAGRRASPGAPPRGASSARGRPRPGRSAPQAAARSASVAASRPGASKRTVVRGRPRRAGPGARGARGRSGAGTPRTPSAGPATPEATSAASTADGPGIGTTAPPSAAHAATSSPPGSRDEGRAGVGDEGEVGPAAQVGEQLGPAGRRVAGVVARRGASAIPWRAKRRRVSRVSSAATSGHGAQHLERPQRDVAEVADRRGDDEEAARRPAAERRGRRAGRPAVAVTAGALPGRRRG